MLLARNTKKFVLGEPVYFRIYAERQNVKQRAEVLSSLLTNAFESQYVPYMYWVLDLPGERVANALVTQYFHPKQPYITGALKAAICLGDDYCDWLLSRMRRKWEKQSQPPRYYHKLQEMIALREKKDYRLIAIGKSRDSRIEAYDAGQLTLGALLDDPTLCESILSQTCKEVLHDSSSFNRSTARDLDILAYGKLLRGKAGSIVKALKKLIGDELPGSPPIEG